MKKNPQSILGMSGLFRVEQVVLGVVCLERRGDMQRQDLLEARRNAFVAVEALDIRILLEHGQIAADLVNIGSTLILFQNLFRFSTAAVISLLAAVEGWQRFMNLISESSRILAI